MSYTYIIALENQIICSCDAGYYETDDNSGVVPQCVVISESPLNLEELFLEFQEIWDHGWDDVSVIPVIPTGKNGRTLLKDYNTHAKTLYPLYKEIENWRQSQDYFVFDMEASFVVWLRGREGCTVYDPNVFCTGSVRTTI